MPSTGTWSCGTGRSRGWRRSATDPAGSRRSPRRPAARAGSATAGRRRCRAAGRPADIRHRPSRPRSGGQRAASPSARATPAHGRPRPDCPSDRKCSPCAATGIRRSPSRGSASRRCRARSAATGRRCRRRSARPSCPARASAIARLAARVDLPTPPLPLPMAIELAAGLGGGHRDPRFGDARQCQRGGSQIALQRIARLLRRDRSRRRPAWRLALTSLRERMRPASGSASRLLSGSSGSAIAGDIGMLADACHCFSPPTLPIVGA